MKKSICLIIIVLTTLLSLVSCDNVSTKNQITVDDMIKFLEDKKIPSQEENSSFVYECETINEAKESNSYQKTTLKYEIYGTINNENLGEYYYEGTSKTNKKEVSLKGTDKTTIKVTEKGSVFLKAKENTDLYVSVKTKVKIPYGKIKQKSILTMLKTDTLLFDSVNNSVLSINYLLELIINTAAKNANWFYYLNDNKLKIVHSTYDFHIEKVFVFEDNKLSKYSSTYTSSTVTTEEKLVFKKVKDVKYPSNLDDYRS